MPRGLPNASFKSIARARGLRREASISEERLWFHLRGGRLGYKFRRQVPFDRYVLDFYCAEARLCVEVDGEQHAMHVDRDRVRDSALAAEGILTFRFPSLALFDGEQEDLDRVLREIVSLCRERSGRDPS